MSDITYLNLDLATGNILKSDGTVWKTARTWLAGGSLVTNEYYDGSNCGDYWSASNHYISLDADFDKVVAEINMDIKTANISGLFGLQISNGSSFVYGVKITNGNIIPVFENMHLDDYTEPFVTISDNEIHNVKIIIVFRNDLSVSISLTFDDVFIDERTFTATCENPNSFLVTGGALGTQVWKLPNTCKIYSMTCSNVEPQSYQEPTLTLSQSNNTLTATATVDPNLEDQTVSYLWGNGETTQSIDITVSGTYSCTITDSIGQTATQSISAEYVEPIAQPTVTITKSEYVLTAIATVDERLQDQTVSYLWSNNATTSSITVSETGTYYCTVTDSIGQTATASHYVVVNYDPVVIITKNKNTCKRGENITLSGFNSYCTNSFITSYAWSTGDDEATIEVTPIQTTTYTLTVTASNGRSSSSSVMVVVESGQIELMKYLPEYWHPNAEMQQIQQNTLNYSLYNLHNAYNVITTEAYIGTSNNARLTEWEHDLGITSSDTLEERRRNILSFFKRKGKLNEENIRLIVNNFANGADCIVEFIPSYIRILIRPRHENETVFPKVESIINAKKPAHLGLYVERYYCTWGEVKDSFATWNDVKNKGSWNDVRLFLPYI